MYHIMRGAAEIPYLMWALAHGLQTMTLLLPMKPRENLSLPAVPVPLTQETHSRCSCCRRYEVLIQDRSALRSCARWGPRSYSNTFAGPLYSCPKVLFLVCCLAHSLLDSAAVQHFTWCCALVAAMEGDMEQKKDDIEQVIHEMETREGKLKSQVRTNQKRHRFSSDVLLLYSYTSIRAQSTPYFVVERRRVGAAMVLSWGAGGQSRKGDCRCKR